MKRREDFVVEMGSETHVRRRWLDCCFESASLRKDCIHDNSFLSFSSWCCCGEC